MALVKAIQGDIKEAKAPAKYLLQKRKSHALWILAFWYKPLSKRIQAPNLKVLIKYLQYTPRLSEQKLRYMRHTTKNICLR